MNRFRKWMAETFEEDTSESKWRLFTGVAILLGLGAIVFRFVLPGSSAISDALILSGSALLVGLLTGFLFGIPRTARSKQKLGSVSGVTVSDYRPNTNLEDISDWLTKMLIGVGLVELKRVPDYIVAIGKYWEPSIGSVQYASGLAIYFSVTGFLAGYLWTRLTLVRDFINRDPRLIISRILRDVAATSERDPMLTARSRNRRVLTADQTDAAEAVQTAARVSRISLDQLHDQVRDLAAVYEGIRASMEPGDERTRRMEVVASQMRALSLAAYPLLGELATAESPGERLAAVTFLQTRPNVEFCEWLVSRVLSEKPFVGYHAAVALLHAARVVPPIQRALLGGAIKSALSSRELPDPSDRRRTLIDALNALLADEEPEDES